MVSQLDCAEMKKKRWLEQKGGQRKKKKKLEWQGTQGQTNYEALNQSLQSEATFIF